MSWLLSKEFRFEAAHYLPHHDGKCQRLHGHSWIAVVYVQSDKLIPSGPKQGMVIDYADISAAMKPLIDGKLDHHYLNESLDMENPTSESIAQWLYTELEPALPGLVAVEVKETCTSRCIYTGGSQPLLTAGNDFTLGGFTR